MKLLSGLLLIILSSIFGNAFAQEYEWIVANTNNLPGERIIAVIDAGDIETFDGVGIVGQIIDNNGNWGYATPIVANFSLFVSFSQGLNYKLIQDRQTKYITLRLRKISDSKVHLTANCPVSHTSMIVTFKKTIGSVGLTLGNSTLIDTSGSLILDKPTYQSFLSGTVAIGTDNVQNEDFSVNGKIKAKEVKVETSWSDFVFEENYPLKPLAEVEAFIKEYGHLPDIPSAKEVEKNGVNVGEMEAKLLQKIEELTLYMIEQQKELKELKKENKAQNKENENLKKELKALKIQAQNEK